MTPNEFRAYQARKKGLPPPTYTKVRKWSMPKKVLVAVPREVLFPPRKSGKFNSAKHKAALERAKTLIDYAM